MYHRYVIIGGGISAAYAIEGIRALDREGSILLLTRENHPPYHRPSLSKDVWTESYDLERLPVHADYYYVQQQVDVRLRHEVVEVDLEARRVWDDLGQSSTYDQLLFATGVRPRRLQVEGAEHSSVRYLRDLEDYLDLERRLERVQHLTIVGGGFTAMEMAATLRARGLEITFLLPEDHPVPRMLPRDIGEGILEYLRDMGVEVVTNDAVLQLDAGHNVLHARTRAGADLTTQLILVDQGGEPQSDLAEAAGLDTDDGIVVDERGRTSRPGVWATGDVAEFPYLALGQLMRVEGSDHAEQHGRLVGRNMAGGDEAYVHLPLKWFRLGDLTFEGVGELNSRMLTEIGRASCRERV